MCGAKAKGGRLKMEAERNSRGWLHLGDGIYEKAGKFKAAFRVDGNRKRTYSPKYFKSEKEARAWKADKVADSRRGEFIAPSRELLAARCDSWLEGLEKEGGYAFGTLRGYEIHIRLYIKPLLGHIRTQLLTIKQCEEAVLDCKAQSSAYTANNMLKTLTMILKEAQRHGVIVVNPAALAKRIKLPPAQAKRKGQVQPGDIYSKEQLADLIEATEAGSLARLVVWLGGLLGLRIGEILGLSWLAIDLKTGLVNIISNLQPEKKGECEFPGYTGKGRGYSKEGTGRGLNPPKFGQVRDLWLPRAALPDFRIWKMKCPRSEPVEFPGMNPEFFRLAQQLVMVTVEGRPLQVKKAQALLDEATAIANQRRAERGEAPIPRRVLHRLRHTFASRHLMDGKEMGRVSKWLGHSDSSTTSRIYAHFDNDDGSAINEMASSILASRPGKKAAE
jgi:integrase